MKYSPAAKINKSLKEKKSLIDAPPMKTRSLTLESSPTVKNAVQAAMGRMAQGKFDKKPEITTKPRKVLYPSANYDDVMKMQRAGQGFGNYSGEPSEFQKAKGGKISLKDCSVSTASKGKNNSCW
jgi:hypothetical protein